MLGFSPVGGSALGDTGDSVQFTPGPYKVNGVVIFNEETGFIDFAGTSSVKVPSGTTAQRPSGVSGLIRYNTTDGNLEGFYESSWGTLQGPSGSGLRATISSTAPESPELGNLWWDSTTATLKVYYVDNDSAQWVNASPTLSDDFAEDVYSPNFIFTPIGLSPESQEGVEVDVAFTLTSSAYQDDFGLSHASSDWQIASDSGFDTIVEESLNDGANLTTYSVTLGAANEGTLYWRVRYRDENGSISNFSAPIEFNLVVPPPPELGDSYCGGFYIGTTTANATNYYLIVAPNATGCALCQWKTTTTATAGTTSLTNGYSNTYGPLTNEDHPAGNWTATRTIGGFSDWYMPARDELNQLYVNDGGATNTTLPAGEGFAAFSYWSSTENSATYACVQRFSDGLYFDITKTNSRRVRAVRREPI